MVHCIYLGVSGYNFLKILYFLSEELFTLTVYTLMKCHISSGSSLFKNVPVLGFLVYKGFSKSERRQP